MKLFLIPVAIALDSLIDTLVAPIHTKMNKNDAPSARSAAPSIQTAGLPFDRYTKNDAIPAIDAAISAASTA